MSLPRSYDTVSEAVNDLKNRGYTANLSSDEEGKCLVCESPNLELSSNDFEIDALYRFEGMTDPGDEMIVMAISSNDNALKGVVVDAFGTYSDGITAKIAQHLKRTRPNTETDV